MNRYLIIVIVILFAGADSSSALTIESVEATRTKNTLLRLRSAFEAYVREYGALPAGDPKTKLAVLTGTSADGQNPLKIVFFEFQPPQTRFYFWTVNPGDRDASGTLSDGWGRPFLWIIEPRNCRITVKSLGKNGRDDGSNKDDEVIVYPPLTHNKDA